MATTIECCVGTIISILIIYVVTGNAKCPCEKNADFLKIYQLISISVTQAKVLKSLKILFSELKTAVAWSFQAQVFCKQPHFVFA